MTERNKELREKVKAVELIAANCLHTQPDGDSSCEAHLENAIESIRLEVSSVSKETNNETGERNKVSPEAD